MNIPEDTLDSIVHAVNNLLKPHMHLDTDLLSDLNDTLETFLADKCDVTFVQGGTEKAAPAKAESVPVSQGAKIFLPGFDAAVRQTIQAVKNAAKAANVAPVNYSIDESFGDCGEIESRDVVDVIDKFAVGFGEYGHANYKLAASELCESITGYFAQEPERVNTSARQMRADEPGL